MRATTPDGFPRAKCRRFAPVARWISLRASSCTHSSFPSSDEQDARHPSKSEFETVLSGSDCVRRPVEDAALRNLQLENLRKAIAELDVQGQNLLSLRYSDALTMDEIGQIYGISKMAVSKRLKKLHEKLGSSVS